MGGVRPDLSGRRPQKESRETVHRALADGAAHAAPCCVLLGAPRMENTLLLGSAIFATAASPLSAAVALNPGQPDRNVQPSVTEGKITFV